MAVPTPVVADRHVPSPREAPASKGAAEGCEKPATAASWRSPADVTLLDSSGVRALVLGLTTSRCPGGRFVLVCARPAVSERLPDSQLDVEPQGVSQGRTLSVRSRARLDPEPWIESLRKHLMSGTIC